jgi:hypothetical protein
MTTLATPVEIRRALGRVAARLRAVVALRGVGNVALVASIGAVVGMAVDFAWPLPAVARWAIWGAWLVLVGVVALVGVIRPLLRPMAAVDLAALAERGQPELGEQLSGSVALIAEGESSHGSRALIAALTGQAAERARSIEPARAISAERASQRLALGLGLVLLISIPPLLRPDPFGRLAARFFAPWLDLDRVGRFALEVNPGDAVVALGSDLIINAKLSPRLDVGIGTTPDAAWFEWDDASGKRQRLRMASLSSDSPASRIFEARLPRLDGPIRYRVTTASVDSRRYQIKAVEPPAIASIRAQVEPPAYTKLPAGPARDPKRIEVVEGSAITFEIATTRPVATVELVWPSFGGSDEPGKILETSNGTIRVFAESPGSYTFTIRPRHDAHGLDGTTESHRLIVRPDAPPTLIVRPAEAKEAGVDDVLTLPITVRDDFAVASAELHYAIKRAGSDRESEPGVHVIALEGIGTTRASGDAALALKSLDLAPGDGLTYRVRVTDNRPAPKGPNVAWSAEETLAIVAKAEPMLARRDRLRREKVQERIEEIKRENLSNRQETTQLRYAADAAQRNPAAWDKERDQALAERTPAARKVIDDLNALARDLEGDPAFHGLASPAKEIADVEAESGRAALAAAKASGEPADRLAALRSADARLGAVQHRIEELQRQFDEIAKLDRDRQRLRDLAAREDALAAEAAHTGDDKAALDALRAEQEAIRKGVDEVANTSPDLKAGRLEAQAKEAAALAEKARALATRQRLEARKTAEETPRAAALKALAEAQRQLEVDARRLALDVDEPLGQNGRSGVNPRMLLEAVPPIERGEVEQGRRRLEQAESELRRLARDIEDVPNDPKALARRLVRRQDELKRHVAEAVREAKGKDNPTPKEQAQLAEAIKPLVAEQAAIVRLAEAIKVDEPRKGAAIEAAQATARALDNLKNVRPREAEDRQDEARQALNRLAEALPDHWRRDEEARKVFEETRRNADEAAREVERHLRETAPEPGRPHDPAKAAVELGRRLEPLARREAEAAARLAKLDVAPRDDPQRRRAERRARALADLLDRARKEAAPLEGLKIGLEPVRNWQIVGPFKKDDRPPFPVDQAIKASAKFKGKKSEVTWKQIQAEGDEGKVNLGLIYSKDNDQGAFAVTELVRPEAGSAKFVVGSDDTMTVWVNGKQVYKVNDSRSYSPEQDRFEVMLKQGINRVVVRCGNGNGEWMYGMRVSSPIVKPRELAQAEAIRQALPQAAVEARASMERLGQKLYGQVPADDAAEELAADATELARTAARPEIQTDPASRHDAADDAHRLAAALRSLPAPDVPALQAEAVRRADAAARALDNSKLDASKAVADAAEAARTLSDRLTDRLTPRAEALALAQAERALDVADPQTQARQGRAVAAEVARLEAESGLAKTNPTPPPQGAKEKNGKPSNPEAKPDSATASANRAAEGAERIIQPSRDPARPDPTPAAIAAARAETAKRLEALADRLPDSAPLANAPPRERPLPDAPRDPELDPLRARTAAARELAQRERKIRERLQTVLNERVEPQESLRQETAALGRELADLRDRSREPGPSGRGHADNAADLLTNQAPRAMDQALDDLAQGRPDAARESQRRAAEQVERAGQAAEDLARALRSDRPAEATPADLEPARGALAEASRRLADEGREPSHGQASAATQALQRAAQALRAAARQGQDAGPPGDAQAVASGAGTADPNKGAPAGSAPADLTELQAMVRHKTGRNWGELPPHLRTEILQLSQGKYRDDYARLIGLYFKEIAADSAKPEK